jgi:6,7-dimethyl-8-ribityllumazine synthase
MPKIYQGELTASETKFAIVVARYNENITGKLLTGALETLQKHGVAEDAIEVAWVPGAWELPLIAQQFAITEKYAAIICLGAVIKGETTHDEHINRQVSQNLGNLALEFNIPIAFGLLTCNSLEQAIHRSGGNVGNKGIECAEAALEMASLLVKMQDA